MTEVLIQVKKNSFGYLKEKIQVHHFSGVLGRSKKTAQPVEGTVHVKVITEHINESHSTDSARPFPINPMHDEISPS